jgi:hypothetical protein
MTFQIKFNLNTLSVIRHKCSIDNVMQSCSKEPIDRSSNSVSNKVALEENSCKGHIQQYKQKSEFLAWNGLHKGVLIQINKAYHDCDLSCVTTWERCIVFLASYVSDPPHLLIVNWPGTSDPFFG